MYLILNEAGCKADTARTPFRPQGNSPSLRHFTRLLLLFDVMIIAFCGFFVNNDGKKMYIYSI